MAMAGLNPCCTSENTWAACTMRTNCGMLMWGLIDALPSQKRSCCERSFCWSGLGPGVLDKSKAAEICVVAIAVVLQLWPKHRCCFLSQCQLQRAKPLVVGREHGSRTLRPTGLRIWPLGFTPLMQKFWAQVCREALLPILLSETDRASAGC